MSPMSQVRYSARSLRAWLASLWLWLASLVISLYTLSCNTLRRRHYVELCTNEESSAPVSAKVADVTIMDMIKAECPSLYGPSAYFKPAWWILGGHFQTVYCVIGEWISRDAIPYARQHLKMPDGGTVSLDVYPPFENADDDTPILFILHGLTGSSQESYIRATVKDITHSKVYEGKKGWRVVSMNFRGCDIDTPVTSPRLYHAGETDDTRSAILWLTQTYPNAPIYGAGFSMGANTLVMYIAEEGENTPLKGTIGVSNPWDWTAGTEFIENGNWLNRYIYGPVLAEALLTVFRNSVYAFVNDERVDILDVYSKRYVNIRFFDDRVTAKLCGYEDAWDYYRQNSAIDFVDRVRTPHLSLQNLDDPIVLPQNVPYAQARKSSHVVMATMYGGGHVASFYRRGWGLGRWFSTPIREFCEAIQSIDPLPRPAPSALEPDAKGMIRSAENPERIGFLPIDAKGLLTARMFSSTAYNPNLGS